MDFLLSLLAALAVAIPCMYMYAVSVAATRLPSLRDKRICLLIAHPDDEAMFFSPTVLALTRQETGNHVKILCLSSGNADGLGETRKKELVKSGMHLGLRDEDDVFVVDNPTDFPDSMTTKWDENKIATLLSSAFAPQLGRSRASNDGNSGPPTANIDVLITFDDGGVSSHPNHISLYHGARAFLRSLTRGNSCPVDLYTLTSVNILRKYSSIVDMFATLGSWAMAARHGGDSEDDKAHPGVLIFMNQLTGEGALPTAWGAMTQAHKSQMVWFRYFWIGLSRYMVMNDLRLERVVRE